MAKLCSPFKGNPELAEIQLGLLAAAVKGRKGSPHNERFPVTRGYGDVGTISLLILQRGEGEAQRPLDNLPKVIQLGRAELGLRAWPSREGSHTFMLVLGG